MTVQEDERPESDIRKRAAWLLVMLAVVAGLFVLLSVTLFDGSGRNSNGGSGGTTGQVDDLPTGGASPAAPNGASSRSAGTSPATSPATSAGSSSAVPTPSCPGDTTCAVTGDVTGAMSAINAYRAQHGERAVPTTSGAAAERCALTSGSDCPSSFVWVRVADLSGTGVVKGVTGFNSSDDLLDNTAKSFEVGWAYNPGSKSLSCAVIRND